MSAQHTPGPWRVKSERWVVATRGEHEGEILIAPTYWMEVAPDEAAANARLIAAAPDLLDCCTKALAAWTGDGPAIDLDTLRAAIAKATGAAS
jgi:hypothetical protein